MMVDEHSEQRATNRLARPASQANFVRAQTTVKRGPLPRLAPNIAEYLRIALRLAHRFSRGQVSAGTLW